MIAHAMKYVGMSQRVRSELQSPDLLNEPDLAVAYAGLWIAEKDLRKAESELVKAYGMWRESMQRAADLGNERAAEYLERTTWDLT